MTVETLSGGWRSALDDLVASARERVTIACPFIKRPVAEGIVTRMKSGTRLTVVTSLAPAAVDSRSLDISALTFFNEAVQASVIALPGLHAKVFVADAHTAIVTSANLTGAGLDSNYEYGVRLSDASLVQKVRRDLDRYSRLGNALDLTTLRELEVLGDALMNERQRLEASASRDTQRRFNATLRRARQRFAEVHVGRRTANELFSIAIRLALESGPQSTPELGRTVQLLLPELCDDAEDLVINGERFGKAWKHRLRNAQQFLKRRGEVGYDPRTRRWTLTAPPDSGATEV